MHTSTGVQAAIQSAKAQAVPYVKPESCLAFFKCPARAVCRSKALVQLDAAEPPFIDACRCYGCDLCIAECPVGAIRLNHQP
jgi:MinD superfamily P-loop ATPase